jgi:phage terminase large subunit-like protein
MSVVPVWTTACPDWEKRIVARQSLLPFDPLFPAEADAALDIFRELRIVDAAGRPTIAEACLPWAFDLPKALFGSYDHEGVAGDRGRRLIQFFFEFVAKKNSKSTRAAGIMVTALMRNWRDSGEFTVLAPTKEIADNSFFPARDMIGSHETLRQMLHVQESQRLITHRNTGAYIKVVAADSETVGGKKTIGLLVDELWLFGLRSGADSMLREAEGAVTSGSRPEGFVVYLSTQSPKPPSGVFAQKLEEFRAIRDGKVHDPRSLPLLHEFPAAMVKSGEYRKPQNFYIPNPNLGKSVQLDNLVAAREKAVRAGKPSEIDFDAKFLNIQVGMAQRADGWAGARIWDRGIEVGLTLDEVLRRSEVVAIGLDGGGLDDLLGVGVIGRERETKRWLGWAHGLISTIGLARRKANLEEYRKFQKQGDLTIFRFAGEDAAEVESDPDIADLLLDVPAAPDGPGVLPTDIRYVVDLVKRVRDLGLLAQVGVDAAGIGAIVDALAEIQITQDAETLDAVRQGIGLMGAFKTIERKLADRSFLHGGSDMLAWCVGNALIVITSTASRIAREDSGFGKIDPLMALFNAAHLMSLNPEGDGGSIFDNADWWDVPKSDAKEPKHVAVPARG